MSSILIKSPNQFESYPSVKHPYTYLNSKFTVLNQLVLKLRDDEAWCSR